MLTFPDGLQYVGQTIHFEQRMKKHASPHSMRGTRIKEWILRYGWDHVKKEVLLVGPNSSLDDDESRLIREKGTMWPSGLNMTPGGNSGNSWGLDPERDAQLRANWAASAKSDNFAKARKRIQELSKLPDIEFYAKMSELRRRAEKRGMPQDKLERLYPNTFTLAQVRKLQGKSWDIPGPKGNKRLTEEEKKQKKRVRKQLWDAKQREKMNAPASSRSRPSEDAPHSPRSAPMESEEVSEDDGWDLGPGPSTSSVVAPPTRAGDLRSEEESESEGWDV